MRNGIKKVYVPEGNKKNLDEIPDCIKKKLEFVFVSNAVTVLKSAVV
ncbi:MAG: hypothetical protein LBN25_01890 [Christensenellaceae bacterium]|nr:hypothetical protein [Christensenellaceae bacterium]